MWESMLSATGVGDGSKLLDAGCGAGGASLLARRLGASVTGVDASQGLLDLAGRRVPDAGFELGDLEALPFPDATFDAVIAASSIQYAEDPAEATRQLARVAKSDGRVAIGLFSTADKVEYRVVFEAIRDSLPEPEQPEGGGPFALSEPGTLEELVESSGMTLIGADEVDCPFTFPDMEAFWAGCISAGPVQAALEVVDAPDLRRRLEEAASPYQLPDGSIHFDVAFRYVTAET